MEAQLIDSESASINKLKGIAVAIYLGNEHNVAFKDCTPTRLSLRTFYL